MISEEKKILMLSRALGAPRFRKLSKHEAVFVCPKSSCPSRTKRKAKLSVNVETDVFNCWVCHFGGKSLIGVLRYGARQALDEYVKSRDGGVESHDQSYEIPSLPEEYVSLTRSGHGVFYDRAIRYVMSRGLTVDDVFMLKLGYAEDGPYRHRIIFPSFDRDGELNFVVGRSMVPGEMKYRHGNFSKDIIFNEYLVDWKKPIVITEGPFDAAVAGENAIPIQGTFVRSSSKLFGRIVSSGTNVILALDSDAVEQQRDLVTMFMLYGVDCWTIDLGGAKDVGEMGRKAFEAAKSNAVHVADEMTMIREMCC